MPTKVSDRIRWGVDAMDIQPSDQVLEIESGHGVAVSLVREPPDDARITAVDRSEKVIVAARTNSALPASMHRSLRVRAEFPDVDLDDRRFSTIFAIHVPLFRRDRNAALARLWRLLAPGGTIHLIGQPPRDDTRVLTDPGPRPRLLSTPDS